MINYSKYLGIPYKENGRDFNGLDCYGLVKLIYDENFKKLPDYVIPFEESLAYQIYIDSKNMFTQLDKPEHGCIVVFSFKPNHIHVGVVIDDNRFIHILPKKNVVIERLNNFFWSKKIIGYYKWNR